MDLTALNWVNAFYTLIQPFPRLYAALFMLPVFSPGKVPTMVRNGLIIAICIYMNIGQTGSYHAPAVSWSSLVWLAKEFAIGAALGGTCMLIILTLQQVGALIDYAGGLTAVQFGALDSQGESTPLARFCAEAIEYLFVAGGGLTAYLLIVLHSFEAWPVDQLAPAFTLPSTEVVIEFGQRVVTDCVLLATPVLIVVLILDVAFGLVSRTAPQIDVLFLAIPVKLFAALFVIGVFLLYFIRNCQLILLRHLDFLSSLFLNSAP